MSRTGAIPIEIPDGVNVTIEGNEVQCEGPLGELDYQVDEALSVELENGAVVVQRQTDQRRDKSLHGLARSIIVNMLEGVTKGFQKKLEIKGTGYRAMKQGSDLSLTIGFSHPVVVEPPEGIAIEVPEATTIIVKGVDKQLVGQVAAHIRDIRPAEPYLGKGIRYEGERVRRKEGKTATSTT